DRDADAGPGTDRWRSPVDRRSARLRLQAARPQCGGGRSVRRPAPAAMRDVPRPAGVWSWSRTLAFSAAAPSAATASPSPVRPGPVGPSTGPRRTARCAPSSRSVVMVPDLSFERVVAFARDLIRIPSPPGGEGDAATRVRAELEALGFDDVWIDDVGNVIGRVRGRGSAPAVVLNSHLDVVDVGDPAEWEHPPFGGEIADGFLHGRGAMDIKGPLAVQTYAAAHFVDERPAGDVIVAHTVPEERGGWGMEHLVTRGEVRPAAVILGEATGGDLCIGHRGRAELLVEISGLAGHASAPERARNALELVPAALEALGQFAAALPSDPVLGRSTLAPTAVET